MVLNNMQKQQLEWLEYDEAFILDDNKGDLTTIPTLIIGVGGTGVKAVVRIKHEIRTRFKEADNVRFLAIDTDKAAANEKAGDLVQTNLTDDEFTLLKGNIASSLKNSQFWMREQEEFMPKNVPYNSGIDTGAGGWRVVGRFLFFQNLATGLVADLEAAIRSARGSFRAENNQSEVDMNIMLVTGIAGGTGSGASIDLAYLIRCILEQGENLVDRYKLTGYIVLPDVNQFVRNNQYSESNGYAYLKELDYLQSLATNGEKFDQSYGNYIYSGDSGPFDECYVFSGADTRGRPISTSSVFEKTMSNIASSISDILTDVDQVNLQSKNKDDKSFLESLKSNIKSIKGNTALNRADCEYDGYMSFGSASFRLPMQQMVQYISALVFERLEPVSGIKPNATDYDELFQAVNLHSDLSGIQMCGEYEYGSEFPHRDWQKQLDKNYSYDKIFADKSRLVVALNKSILEKVKVLLDNNRNKTIVHFSNTASDYFENAFTNSDRGPWFVDRLFGYSNPVVGSITVFDQIDNVLEAVADAEKEANNRVRLYEYRIEELENESPKLLGRTKKVIVKDYIQTHLDMYEEKKRILYYKEYKALYKKYKSELENTRNQRYGLFVEVLERLLHISKGVVRKLEKQDSQVFGTSGSSESFVDMKLLCESLRENFKNVNVTNKQLLSHLQKNDTKVLGQPSGDGVDIVSVIHSFIATHYSQSILKFSLYEALLWTAGIEQKQSKSTDMISNPVNAQAINMGNFITSNIRQQLASKSRSPIHLVSDNINEVQAIMNQATYERIAVPDSQENDDLFNELNKGINKLKPNDTVDRVSDDSKISEINFVFGFPIYMYSYLKGYQQTYEMELVGQNILRSASLHLFRTKERDWKDLPNLIPNFLNSTTPSKREDERTAQITELFNQAVQYGIIAADNGQRYTLNMPNSRTIYLGVGNRAVMRLQKMFNNIPIVEKMVKEAEQKELIKQQQAEGKRKAKETAMLFFTDVIKKEESSYVYTIQFGENTISLGNHLRNRNYPEFYVYKGYEELVSEDRKAKAVAEAEKVYTQLTENVDKYLETLAAFRERIRKAQDAIIDNEPEDKEELQEFYENLAHYVRNL